MSDDHAARFAHDRYLVRKKILSILGAKFHIYDGAGRLVLFSKMKAFKLREDIRLYSDESMSTELIAIKARHIIDFSAAYDVIDVTDGQRLGALRRKGFSSMVRDEWQLLDTEDNQVGSIKEDSTGAALARRLIPLANLLMPQGFYVDLGGRAVCMMKQRINPIVHKLEVDFSVDADNLLDPRLGLAAAVLITAIEGRQDS